MAALSAEKYDVDEKTQDVNPQLSEAVDNVIDEQLKALDAGHNVQLKSEFDNLTMLQTIKTFKWSVLISAAAAFTAVLEGYQLQLTSSIVANKGFIQQFGYPNAQGVYALVPSNVSAFGGLSR